MFCRLSKSEQPIYARFSNSERGSLTILSLFLFLGMLIICGMAVDLMVHEARRSRLQNSLDTAVLAAASWSQRADRVAVIDDYMRRAGYDPNKVERVAGVNSTESHAEAFAQLQTNTMFMNLVGVEHLSTPTHAIATETISGLELSLVLDLSGTMEGDRLANLRLAVATFVDTIFGLSCDSDGDCATSTGLNPITVNVIPYSGTVNPGQDMAEYIGMQGWHDWSHCSVLESEHFEQISLPRNSKKQYPHYNMWHVEDVSVEKAYGWCPKEENKILYAETDPQKIKDFVNRIQLYDGTGTDIGMKWGVSLLDPGSRDAFNMLISRGEIEGNTSGTFPRDYSPNVKKIVVVMTDGNITPQLVPVASNDEGWEHLNFDFFWMYDRSDNLRRRNGSRYTSLRADVYKNYGNEATKEFVESNSAAGRRAAQDNPYVDEETALANLLTQCDMAKETLETGDERMTVYSIRFLDDQEWTQEYMQDCASHDSYFYDVQDLNIESAFASIASHINFNRLRLTN